MSHLLTIAMIAAALHAAAAPSSAADPPAAGAPSYRVFLTDGTPLVSYGEFARANGRVVFTVPIGTSSEPDALQVVSLQDAVIDWDRTNRYADTVRHRQYAATRGEIDFAALTGAVARALGDMAFAVEPTAKLAVASEIRRQLLEWPAAHYGYRSSDVRELTAYVEESVSQIRAAAGQRAFDVSLVAMVEPPSEPLLPEPDLGEALDAAAAAARVAESPRERRSLQESILAVLERRKADLPRDWYSSRRRTLKRSVERERSLDRDYAKLSSRALNQARHLEADTDVAGLERLTTDLEAADGRLGYERPDMMQALFDSLTASVERAQQRRLATARYEQRRSAYGAYRSKIGDALETFGDVAEDIGAVRAQRPLGGKRSAKDERRVTAIEVSLLPVSPPEELRAAHELLVSSARLMREALRLNRSAGTQVDSAAALNASAAAAGALLLLDTARNRIDEFFRPPAAP